MFLLLVRGTGLFLGLGVLLVGLLILGEAGVLTETLKLSLDVLHVVGELGAGLPAALAVGHAGDALGLAVALEPPEEEVSDGGGDANDEEGTEDGETLGVLLEAGGEAKKDERNGEKHDKDINDGESTPDAGGLAELAGEVEGNTAKEGDGVPDEDATDVEEEVSEGGLHGGDLVGDEGGHYVKVKSREYKGECRISQHQLVESHSSLCRKRKGALTDGGKGCADVGSKGEGIHLLELDDAHADEGGKSRGGNR